jgi:sialic acid synthase SpsE
MLPSLVAVARGARLIERHYTLDKSLVGFDHKISLEPDELIQMVRSIRSIPRIIGTGEKTVSETEQITFDKYHVSMVTAKAIKKGETITADKVAYKNPGTGIPPKEADTIIGKPASQDIPADTLLKKEMVKQHERQAA